MHKANLSKIKLGGKLMKKSFLRKITCFVLMFVLLLGLNSNIQASEILKDELRNPFLEGKAIDIKDVGLDYMSIKKLPASLEINKINIDIDSLHDTNPLTIEDKNMLFTNGYSLNQIKAMDRGDFLKVRNTWKLNIEEINAAKIIYPELENMNLNEWTYEQFINYSKIKDSEKYKPSSEQAQKLLDRGITLKDARYMIKDFYSYDSILNLSDYAIKEYLLNYYNLKEIYAKSLIAINRKNDNIIESKATETSTMASLSTTTIIGGATYFWCYIPGYGEDWFHEASGTHLSSNNILYGSKTQNIFSAIYPSGSSYSAANMWGTYSAANGGAHEGIDFNGTPEGQSLKAIVKGNLGQRSSSYGLVAISSTESNRAVNYRIFYMHMKNISSSSSINAGATIGTEAGVGPNGEFQFDEHLHLQVYHNQSKTYCDTSSNNVLESNSPYSILDTYIIN